MARAGAEGAAGAEGVTATSAAQDDGEVQAAGGALMLRSSARGITVAVRGLREGGVRMDLTLTPSLSLSLSLSLTLALGVTLTLTLTLTLTPTLALKP